MKTFQQFNEQASYHRQQLDEIAPLAAIPLALKLGGAALTAFSGLSAINNLRKGKFKQAAFDALGAIPGGKAFKLAKGLGATKNIARGASALQSANRLNLTGLTPNTYAKGVDKAFDVAGKGVMGTYNAGKSLLAKNNNKPTTNKNIATTKPLSQRDKEKEKEDNFRAVQAGLNLASKGGAVTNKKRTT
tara:strand:+ start:18 stop:584 length:567 start_codon:yes stop_codon:yes gene_type:complete